MVNNESSIDKNNDYSELKNHILFHKEEMLIEFVKAELLLPTERASKINNDTETQNLLNKLENLLNFNEQIRTLGIARADKMISDYKNQDQVWTTATIMFTIIGLLLPLLDAPTEVVIIYLVALLVGVGLLVKTLINHKKKVGIAAYLKTLLEQSSFDKCERTNESVDECCENIHPQENL